MRDGYRYAIIDCETDGLVATLIHCLCYKYIDSEEIVSLTDYEEMRKFLLQDNLVVICHNAIRYDNIQLERVLGIKIKYQTVDTLILSWYLLYDLKRHGLEEHGERYGIKKPVITSWTDLKVEDYIWRCRQDVLINFKLWEECYNYLLRLYNNNFIAINNLFKYFEFKLKRAAERETVGVRFDKEKCIKVLAELEEEYKVKTSELSEVMPKNKIYGVREYPAKPYKKDGTLSSHGIKWFNFLDAHNISPDNKEPVRYIKELESGNPGSPIQLKQWLTDLGWEPQHIAYNRDKETGEVSEVPQIKNKDPERSDELCESVVLLFSIEPKLQILEGLTILAHRISVLKKFLRDSVGDRLFPSISGITNTFRLRHKIVVNLPKVSKKYGDEIRSCLIADEGRILAGADLSNIESTTRNHYIFPINPEYVADMTKPNFDSHIDIAVLAKLISKEEQEFFRWYKNNKYIITEEFLNSTNIGCTGKTLKHMLESSKDEQKVYFTEISEKRQQSKQVNFSAIYGVSALTMHRKSGLPLELCKKLLIIYWERNGAVKILAEKFYTKVVDGKEWVFNPVSKFFYQLRHSKDKFSSVNQSTADYVFNIWLSFLVKQGIIINYESHDECLFNIMDNSTEMEKAREMLKIAIKQTNDFLKLNVLVDCSVDFGKSYNLCH